MICCEKCFKDLEIKSMINSLNVIGDCGTCNRKDVFIYDTTRNDTLVDSFNNLLEIYTPVYNLSPDFPRGKLSLLKDVLYEWNIFNLDKEKIYFLIREICNEKYQENPDLFDSPIGIQQLVQEDYLIENSLLKTHRWEDFVTEIRSNNRYHTNFINTSVLERICSYITTPYKQGTILYRARISNEEGFPAKDMWSPPSEKASAGRVNPLGISYLYLAGDLETTLYEVRAGAYDYVTIANFVLKEDITIIDFTLLDRISPFANIDVTQLAINKEHLRKINEEIAKPLRRSDSPLDYLSTQYIADFIKSKGYKGIKYKSTLNKDGYNISIFDETFFECVDVRVYDVERIDYRYNAVEE